MVQYIKILATQPAATDLISRSHGKVEDKNELHGVVL